MHGALIRTSLSAAAVATALALGAPARAEEAAGDWGGLLAGRLHVIVHIEKTAAGDYRGATESPDQTDAVVEADTVTATPEHLHMNIGRLNAVYDANWDGRRHAWVGALVQGATSRLDLTRLDAAGLSAMRRPPRPQERAIAAAPRPYSEEEVRFDNPAAPGVRLAGSFTRPAGEGPFPCVVLVAGSGRLGRDEDVYGHRPLFVMADALARRGVASLRYDKRGVDASTGDYQRATIADLTSDAAAAVAYVRTLAEIDPSHIGVLGHSEGAAIAPAVAAADGSVAFVVMLAGPGQRGDQLLLLQERLIAAAAGAAHDQIERRAALDRKLFDAVLAAHDEADAKMRVPHVVAPAVAEGTLPRGAVDAIADQLSSPWLFHFLRYDPAPVLRRLHAPVLALAGSLDLQVPPKENLELIRTALRGDAHVTVLELPGLNHAFQAATTGSPDEYNAIEQTLSPLVLKVVTDWILQNTR